MANHNLPTVTSGYLNFVSEMNGRLVDCAAAFDPAFVTVTNPPANTVRFSSAANTWQRWNGTAWVALTATYAINISGNAATATNVAFGGLTGTVPTWNQNTTGSAATVTNGVYTVGAQAIGGVKTFSAQDRHNAGVGVDANTHLNLNGGNAGLGWGITETASDGWLRFETRTDLGAYTTRMSVDTSWNLSVSGNVTAFSDIRLKTDITKITDALAKVNQLNGYTYTRIDTGERQTGVIAQELQKVLPEAVLDDGETLSVAYGNMMGLMIEAVKELTARIAVLEAR